MVQNHIPHRRIAHLDMDAFFASVELLTYPELRGRAVVVGGRNTDRPIILEDGNKCFARLGDYVGRGVVTTSTYEARELGVFSGMGLMRSAKLAPDAIILPANFNEYREKSRQFKEAVASIAPKIENRGIDEIFIDLTDLEEESQSLALRIKRAVFDATGLTCSIGITPNKLLSKICSDLEKPDGVTILHFEDMKERVWPLSTKKINGIGPKAFEKLKSLGIHTIGDLSKASPQLLMRHFGNTTGEWLNRSAQGVDDRPVILESEPKSISRESTFERDLHAKVDRDKLSEIFTDLCMRVSEDLKRKGYACKTVGIKLRYSDFHSVTRDITLSLPVTDGANIRKAAGECLKRIPLNQRIRLLGVRASGLVRLADLANHTLSNQGDLFS
ncbi:nucleotidyltransferase/DNA polymerase involved in DNA repair [Herbaspirillum sp. CF444]|uniref:DNA polymerase IV n=1 Tax=Herbaspirillum sp. CF444 TaxID=1144319 RepID=UPI0002726E6D|nr:DNA polymerase IV [Herbaspirillum sp. CF444]EJL88519.1 nucleotidyltransferase/DNA polymerase involved in DNA repair [Herbaspirillum sp. CF444]